MSTADTLLTLLEELFSSPHTEEAENSSRESLLECPGVLLPTGNGFHRLWECWNGWGWKRP